MGLLSTRTRQPSPMNSAGQATGGPVARGAAVLQRLPVSQSDPPKKPVLGIPAIGLVGCFTFSIVMAVVAVLIYIAIKALL